MGTGTGVKVDGFVKKPVSMLRFGIRKPCTRFFYESRYKCDFLQVHQSWLFRIFQNAELFGIQQVHTIFLQEGDRLVII